MVEESSTVKNFQNQSEHTSDLPKQKKPDSLSGLHPRRTNLKPGGRLHVLKYIQTARARSPTVAPQSEDDPIPVFFLAMLYLNPIVNRLACPAPLFVPFAAAEHRTQEQKETRNYCPMLNG